ncbi:uncharacterized protein LOC113556252 [Rhopalosiphum maidis]|uniref:uncharacterized protein LOC113556252 n=1 Tax=Rhopalosiphum maidis TaxID=43146 RepID=UPI000F0023EE|nr:uncharacterized protein LOC113556252 [Rhopalosiphum maidis]
MKLNTSLFMCLFFSAIVAIKAANDYEEYNEEYENNENTVNEMPEEEYSLAEEEEQDVQEGADHPQQVPQEVEFQYIPSKRVEEMETNLPSSAQAFIPDGKVKETFINTFNSAMATDLARTGYSDVQRQWQELINGPEAPRVIGTFGQNFNKIFTSPDGSDMINMLATTTHVLLSKSGEEKMSAGLADLVSLTYSLLTSNLMPDIINKTGGLVITAVNKPRATLFVRTYWDGIRRLFSERNLNDKMNKYFTNIMSMMKSMNGVMQGGRQLRRKRSFA